MKAIILAGGKGSRLWPLSRETHPKQLIDFGDGESLLQKTIRRLSPIFPLRDILISSSEKHHALVQRQTEHFPDLLHVVEPVSRGTAPAICLSLKALLEKGGSTKKSICLVCPSDHYFSRVEDFFSLLSKAKEGAKRGAVVTFGIKPTYPETEYGYMRARKEEGDCLLLVEHFIEKPVREMAEHFLEEGDYFWNAGIFVFEIGTFLEILKEEAPHFAAWFEQPFATCYHTFNTLPSISFDRAFMEKIKQILLVPYPSTWSDLGSWDRIYHMLPKDQRGNVIRGDVKTEETSNSLIFSTSRKIVVTGLEDVVVVDTGDALLITKKEKRAALLGNINFLSHND